MLYSVVVCCVVLRRRVIPLNLGHVDVSQTKIVLPNIKRVVVVKVRCLMSGRIVRYVVVASVLLVVETFVVVVRRVARCCVVLSVLASVVRR